MSEKNVSFIFITYILHIIQVFDNVNFRINIKSSISSQDAYWSTVFSKLGRGKARAKNKIPFVSPYLTDLLKMAHLKKFFMIWKWKIIFVFSKISILQLEEFFYAPAASVRWGLKAFGLSACPSENQVKIFVQGRISRPINGSKLIFHMRMYLSKTSRNVQEPWPHGLYFMVHWLWTLARLSRLRFLSKVESQDLLMVASCYFTWGCISMISAVIYKSHDLLTYISRSADCKRLPIFHG